MHFDALLIVAIGLGLLHFGFPLAYYCYLKKLWLNKPWDVRSDPEYKPRVSIIVPTYNEAKLVRQKLDDIASQDYPKNLVEIIVVDSASTDGTLEVVKEWIADHRDVKAKLIEENARRGKAHALNKTLKVAMGEVVIITDVDSAWPSRDTLASALSWFSDPLVGAVTCLKVPTRGGFIGVERGYRDLYNVVRLCESKRFSTPVFHGELAAFRRDLLVKLGGFPVDIGADDSHTATLIAISGFRAIAVDNALCTELVPREGYHMWRIRRAQHLIQHFAKALGLLSKAPRGFKPVLLAEAWLLLVATTILLYKALTGTATATILLAAGTALLLFKPYRTWIATQAYLVTATIRNLWTKEIAWEKQEKS
ncbi:glycosyltransferase [Thermosphaera aggregans]|uniref:Glycosyl transferase family 2 n=1 Tax=Thermosphaera aggregans (strain DSM 11486 / M11TL) TaxID=633148 RepID=D5U154_THEAM|nr:glycosyltransferase [Thermosphaera aggregans]ADG90854.1 glycosyl transferase family 2 [Thermosphaera aggregans DSM 11486]